MLSFYYILRIKPNASRETIEAAYRRLLERYDPDKHEALPADAATTVRQIMAAYRVLSDPAKRALYDERLAAKKRETQAAAPAAQPIPEPIAPQPAPSPFATVEVATAHPVYAGFWRRYAAMTLDSLIVAVPLLVIGVAAVSTAGPRGDRSVSIAAGTIIPLCFIVLSWLYNAVWLSGPGRATLGMRALRLEAVDAQKFDRISFARATRRYFASLLSGIALCIGYLIQPFTPRRQALHDLLAGTVVLATGKANKAFVAATAALGLAVPAAGMLAAIALPAYRDYAMQAQIGEALEVGDVSRRAVEAYFRVNRAVPPSLDAAGAPRPPADAPYRLTMNPQSGLIIIAFDLPPVKDKMIMYAPGLDQAGNLTLLCVNQGVPTKYMRGCNSGQ